jgi:hypothetical protein
MVEIEQEDGPRPSSAEEKYSQGIDPFTDNGTDVNTNETDKHEAWL